MSPIILNNPPGLPWQTNLFDALMAALFVAACVNAIVQFRRGTRIYAFVLVSALVYGVALELAGMATLNVYVQGRFAVPMFQYWMGWPLVDMFWQSTWGATFLYLMLRARPHIDGTSGPRWSSGAALGVRAPLAAVTVLLVPSWPG